MASTSRRVTAGDERASMKESLWGRGCLGVQLEVDEATVTDYQRTLPGGIGAKHPGDLVEPAMLASVHAPALSLQIPLETSLGDAINAGRISGPQLDAVAAAYARHTRFFPDESRMAILIGDGTGVGKGRQAAAIIHANRQTYKKAIWVSCSMDLLDAAKGDLSAVGYDLPVHRLKESELPADSADGVLFITYSYLATVQKDKKRESELFEWLGGCKFEGVMILDEAQNAKNYSTSGDDSSSATAVAVNQIVRAMSRCRLVYMSATAMDEPGKAHYLQRLGLYGNMTKFKTFNDLIRAHNDVGGKMSESIALELKASGALVVREIGDSGVEYNTLEVPMEARDAALHDKVVELCWDVRGALYRAADRCERRGTCSPKRCPNGKHVCHPGGRWVSAVTRVVAELFNAWKVGQLKTAIDDARRDGNHVVISIQTTGDAARNKEDASPGVDPHGNAELFSLASLSLTQYIQEHYPTTKVGNTDPDPDLVEEKKVFLERVTKLALPGNTLDRLKDAIGGDAVVAEVTGRKMGMKRVAGGGWAPYKLRDNAESVRMFMDGDLQVLIYSEAGGTGASYHAATWCKSKDRRRVHFILESSFSIHSAKQQCGRVHRSSQASTPVVRVVRVREAPADRRTLVSLAKRAKAMSAVSRGDGRVSAAGVFGGYDYDTEDGEEAVQAMFCPTDESLPVPTRGVDAARLRDGLEGEDKRLTDEDFVNALEDGRKKAREIGRKPKVADFFTTLMLLSLRQQRILFGMFDILRDDAKRRALDEGRRGVGIPDIQPNKISHQRGPTLVDMDECSEATTWVVSVTQDRSINFEDARRMVDNNDDAFFYQAKRDSPAAGRRGRILVAHRVAIPGKGAAVRTTSPATGTSVDPVMVEQLEDVYTKVVLSSSNEATIAAAWNQEAAEDDEPWFKQKKHVTVTVLYGSTTRFLPLLAAATKEKCKYVVPEDDGSQICRLTLQDGQRVVGRRINEYVRARFLELVEEKGE